MNKILAIIIKMTRDKFVLINSDKSKIVDHIIKTPCQQCHKDSIVTIGAVYKQFKRGNHTYICKSCAAKHGWTKDKRDKASVKTKKLWTNPDYAGTIDGKAIANEIKRLINMDLE